MATPSVCAYACEQATHHRKPPVLVERGLLADAR
jgi:hypothetical protein